MATGAITISVWGNIINKITHLALTSGTLLVSGISFLNIYDLLSLALEDSRCNKEHISEIKEKIKELKMTK